MKLQTNERIASKPITNEQIENNLSPEAQDQRKQTYIVSPYDKIKAQSKVNDEKLLFGDDVTQQNYLALTVSQNIYENEEVAQTPQSKIENQSIEKKRKHCEITQDISYKLEEVVARQDKVELRLKAQSSR